MVEPKSRYEDDCTCGHMCCSPQWNSLSRTSAQCRPRRWPVACVGGASHSSIESQRTRLSVKTLHTDTCFEEILVITGATLAPFMYATLPHNFFRGLADSERSRRLILSIPVLFTESVQANVRPLINRPQLQYVYRLSDRRRSLLVVSNRIEESSNVIIANEQH